MSRPPPRSAGGCQHLPKPAPRHLLPSPQRPRGRYLGRAHPGPPCSRARRTGPAPLPAPPCCARCSPGASVPSQVRLPQARPPRSSLRPASPCWGQRSPLRNRFHFLLKRAYFALLSVAKLGSRAGGSTVAPSGPCCRGTGARRSGCSRHRAAPALPSARHGSGHGHRLVPRQYIPSRRDCRGFQVFYLLPPVQMR